MTTPKKMTNLIEMKKLTKKLNPTLKALHQAACVFAVFSLAPNPIITPKQLFALIIKSPV